jgi:hypothetical protein
MSPGRFHFFFTLALTALLSVSPLWSQDEPQEEHLFYHARPYGSEALFNPISHILNGSFGILQYPNRSREIFDISYRTGFINVTQNLSHPFASISHYGWKNFIDNEVIPGSLNRKNAQYWPNYQNHLIGGGMDFVLLSEWYQDQHYPSPKLFGFGTMVIYHMLNETVENNAYVGDNVDPIADLMIFDPLSFVLFSIHGVPEFFSHTLHMANWSGQPDYNPWTRSLENHGVNYAVKWKLPFSDNTSLFYYWGLTGLVGLSHATSDGHAISFGAGLRAKELVPEGDQTNGRKLTADLTWNTGVFYDLDNSLLASILFSGISDYKLHLNVYPGIFSVAGVSPGVFSAFGDGGKFVAGMNVAFLPFGLAAGRSE